MTNALEQVLRVFAEQMVGDSGRWAELLRPDDTEADGE